LFSRDANVVKKLAVVEPLIPIFGSIRPTRIPACRLEDEGRDARVTRSLVCLARRCRLATPAFG